MNNYDLSRLVIGLVAVFIVTVAFVSRLFLRKKPITTKFISKTAIFAAFSIILYIVPGLKFPLPIFPQFLEIHLDEIPLLICGFAYGPWSAIFALAIKTIVKLPMTTTLCVGEIADFIYSLAFILPSAIIYKHLRKFKGAILSLTVGTICQLVVSCLFTTFVMLNFYMNVMGLSEEVILNMVRGVGINISNLGWPFCLMVALPFNAMKDGIVIAITLLLYKKMHKLIEKIIK